ncbi:MAG: sigma 54-interacting transcriptional regulator [Ignavibacteriales bacterium]
MSTIRSIMNENPVTLSPEFTVRHAAHIFEENRIDGAPVVDAEKHLLGLFTKRIIFVSVSQGLNLDEILVGDLMNTGVIVASPEDSIEDFKFINISRIPVVDKQNRLVGMGTLADIVRYMFGMGPGDYWHGQTMMDAIDNPVIFVDRKSRISFLNRAALDSFKLDYSALGKSAESIMDDNPFVEVLQNGHSRFGRKVVTADRVYISNCSAIHSFGLISGAVAVLHDISELETISKELASTQRLNQKLDAIFESSFDGLYITDGEGLTLMANKSVERIAGITVEECVGRYMSDLVREGVWNRSGSLLAIEKREMVTITSETRTGKTVLVTSTPITDEAGNIVLVVTNMRDITELNELKHQLEKMEGLSRLYLTELQQLKLRKDRQLVFNSPKMQELTNMIIRLAGVDSTALVQGESGVGKELVAELIHSTSSRSEGPLVKVNCGAIPENLLESELFGYEAGAFTGASREGKVGLFELANKGTLFLDEIGELPLLLQVKLLRVLQSRELTRVGGIKPIKIDVRIIAGSNRNLEMMVKNGQFREDLFYRLNVVPVNVPPLRERKDDIPMLTAEFLQRINLSYNLHKSFSPAVIKAMLNYSWPGNVRELENLVERLAVMTPQDLITVEDLPDYMGAEPLAQQSAEVWVSGIIPLKEAVGSVEKQILEKAFARYGTVRQMAEELQVDPATIVRKAKKYNLIR